MLGMKVGASPSHLGFHETFLEIARTNLKRHGGSILIHWISSGFGDIIRKRQLICVPCLKIHEL